MKLRAEKLVQREGDLCKTILKVAQTTYRRHKTDILVIIRGENDTRETELWPEFGIGVVS
jgi:hypothetical protein